MKVFVFLLLATFFVASLADEGVVCPDGEVATDCYAHCQGTCENPYATCLPICVPGCVCPDGFLRNGDDGPCVPYAEC